MPAGLSADGLRRGPRVRAITRAATFTAGQKVLLLLLNAWPVLHLVAVLGWLMLPPWAMSVRVGVTAAWILLLPPLLCRILSINRLPAGDMAVPSPEFFRWWMSWQLQMVFNRFSWIEEGIRFVPGIYSFWLRLWGARVGRLTLWSPGVRLYDRPLVRIGDDVVIGIEACLLGHFGGLDSEGRAHLIVGPVKVGDRTTVGGRALLGPGLVLEADQFTETLFLGTPFSQWRAGERVRTEEFSSKQPHS